MLVAIMRGSVVGHKYWIWYPTIRILYGYLQLRTGITLYEAITEYMLSQCYSVVVVVSDDGFVHIIRIKYHTRPIIVLVFSGVFVTKLIRFSHNVKVVRDPPSIQEFIPSSLVTHLLLSVSI